MSLSDIAKRILPRWLLNVFGVYGICLITKNGYAMAVFSRMADSRPLDVELLHGGLCSRNVNGKDIICYRDGFRVFHEIFDVRPYEKYWSPGNGDVVLDLGAYVGMFSYRSSLLVGENGLVVAVEPERRNFELLNRNLSELVNIFTVNAAIGEYDGVSELYLSPKSTCHNTINKQSGRKVQARLTTIDSLVKSLDLPRVDFIKMDIEGAELRALIGATETLKNNNVKLAIESYHASDMTGELVAEYLKLAGYKVYREREYIYAQRA